MVGYDVGGGGGRGLWSHGQGHSPPPVAFNIPVGRGAGATPPPPLWAKACTGGFWWSDPFGPNLAMDPPLWVMVCREDWAMANSLHMGAWPVRVWTMPPPPLPPGVWGRQPPHFRLCLEKTPPAPLPIGVRKGSPVYPPLIHKCFQGPSPWVMACVWGVGGGGGGPLWSGVPGQWVDRYYGGLTKKCP